MGLILSIVTGNSGKYNQIRDALPNFLTTQQVDCDLPEIQTASIAAISADKARKAYDQLQGSVLVDDSGICFDAFNNFPGALSKFFYQGVGLAGMQRLYEGVSNRRAHYQCVLSYMDQYCAEPYQCLGRADGTITFAYLDQAIENPALPYDLIFLPDAMDTPPFFDPQHRADGINHRSQATMKFAQWIEQHHTLYYT